MKHFFDIGANIGQVFGGYLNGKREYDGAHVWCFEPSPRHWPKLTAAAARNASRYDITLCPCAIGAPGFHAFFQSQSGEGDTRHRSLRTHNNTPMRDLVAPYSMRVASLTIEAVIMEVTSPGDNVTVKLDCEGCEYDILRGLLNAPEALSRCTRFLVEFHIMADRDWAEDKHAITKIYAEHGITLEPWVM